MAEKPKQTVKATGGPMLDFALNLLALLIVIGIAWVCLTDRRKP